MIFDSKFDTALAKELDKSFSHLKYVVMFTYVFNALFFIFTRYEINALKKSVMSLQASDLPSTIISDELSYTPDDSNNQETIEKATTWSSWLSSLDVKHVLIAIAVTSVIAYFGVNYYNSHSSIDRCASCPNIDPSTQTGSGIGSKLTVPTDSRSTQTNLFGPGSESNVSMRGDSLSISDAELWIKSAHPFKDVAIEADLVSVPNAVNSSMMFQDFLKNIKIFRRSDDPSYFDLASHVEGVFTLRSVGKLMSFIIPVGASEIFAGNVIKAAVDAGGSAGSEVSVPIPNIDSEDNANSLPCNDVYRSNLKRIINYTQWAVSSVIATVASRLSYSTHSGHSDSTGNGQSVITPTGSESDKIAVHCDPNLNLLLESDDNVHKPSTIYDQPDDQDTNVDTDPSDQNIIEILNDMFGR